MKNNKHELYWILFFCLQVSIADEVFKPIVGTLAVNPRTNISVGRSLPFDEEEILAREAGYYQFPAAPPLYGPPPPPVYGPPNEYPGQSEGNVEIEFLFNELTIECVVEKPLEHIIWTRFPCPNQLYFGEGIHVADGAMVYNEDLYDVQIRGFNGIYFSELTIRDPIGPESSGLYRCEAWPHFHRNGNNYQPYGSYPYYSPVESDVFIIGGNSLLEDCYGTLPSYPSYGNKVTQAITNKKPSNNQADKLSKIKENNFKIRRNSTKNAVDRKDANTKYLRYNVKFDNDPVSKKNYKNITMNGFLPSLKFPFQSRHNDIINPPKGPTSHLVGNLTSSIRFDFSGNGNNKTWQSKLRRTNLLYGKDKNLTVESLANKSVFPRNQTQSR